MAKLVPVYQLILKDTTGTQVAIIDDYRSLQFQKIVNDSGFFTLILNENDPKRSLFERDGQLEIKRKIPGLTNWYTEFECVILDFTSVIFQNGNAQFTVVGAGYNELLKRRVIAFQEETVYSKKNDNAETVMKEYVIENIGADALVVNGRYYDGDVTGFNVEVDTGAGAIWGGERSGKNLLSTLQEIANYSSIDFNVVGTGAGTYEFRTYLNQLGDDRTTVGLNTTTGLNAAGNPPQIFNVNLGNVKELLFQQKSKDTANTIYVYGQNYGASRDLEIATDIADIALSPFGVREMMRGGGSQASAVELQYLADELLISTLPRTDISFIPLDIVSSLYGVHYFFGDKVTIHFNGVDYDKRIVSVRVSVSPGGEGDKTFTFADIPRV